MAARDDQHAASGRRCLHDMIAGTVVLHDPEKVLAE